jgi:hypothetical protein
VFGEGNGAVADGVGVTVMTPLFVAKEGTMTMSINGLIHPFGIVPLLTRTPAELTLSALISLLLPATALPSFEPGGDSFFIYLLTYNFRRSSVSSGN